MVLGSLFEVEQAVRLSWAADTCGQDDLAREAWSEGNPAWGHCDVTALVVNDLLGGDLMLGDVFGSDGSRQGFHYWNRLGSGLEVDLTREQFRDGQSVVGARVVERLGREPRNRRREYTVFRARVGERLGFPPEDDEG